MLMNYVVEQTATNKCSKAPALRASGLKPHFTSLCYVKRLLTLARWQQLYKRYDEELRFSQNQ